MVVLGIGLVGGGVSGFLGIGGGIVIAPLLLYVPAGLGLTPLSMHAVSGLTITQTLFAGLLGAWLHGRRGTVDRRLAGVMSAVIFGAALAGAGAAPHFSHEVLLWVFATLALVAAVLLFRPGRSSNNRGTRSRLPEPVQIDRMRGGNVPARTGAVRTPQSSAGPDGKKF